MADFRSIIQDIHKKNFAPVYLLMGEEPYYIDKITEALEKAVVEEEDKEFDQTILYGAESNAAMVMEAASQFPLMSQFRLVTLKEAQAYPRASKAEMDKLKPYIENPNPHTVLCIAYKGEKLGSPLLNAAKKQGKAVVFESPKIKEYKLGETIKDYCRVHKILIDDKAIELLAANVGSSLSNLFSEIEKLRVALKGGDSRIDADLVSDHIGISKTFNLFELTGALCRRDYYQSLFILKYFEENPKNYPTQPIVGMIFKLFQQLLLAAFSADKRDETLMDILQLKTKYALKDIRTGLQNYNASQLVKAIRVIRDFDTRSKGIGSFQKEYPLMRELVLNILTL